MKKTVPGSHVLHMFCIFLYLTSNLVRNHEKRILIQFNVAYMINLLYRVSYGTAKHQMTNVRF